MPRPPRVFAAAALALYLAGATAETASKPNFVIFFGDDWGWGDLGENNEEVRGLTPNFDKLAQEGLRFTNFHVGASVCTPSRAALLTGRLGPRTGVINNFGPSSLYGLPRNETTIAEFLKKEGGYRTGMVGKWHLGVANGHHPMDRGFDWYVGLPYSDDMGCGAKPTAVMAPMNDEHTIFCPACAKEFNETQDCQPDHSCGRPNGCFGMDLGVPLFHNRTIVAQPVDLGAVSNNYTAEVRTFLTNAAAAPEPFFLYYAASHVHVPQNHDPRWDDKIPSTPFAHREGGGAEFAAALMEMDDEMGNLMGSLEENGVQNDTLIMVTGDNGNWECKCNLTGSHGPYAGQWQKDHGGGSSSKCTLFEAGHREVGIFRWTGTIKPGGVTGVIASSLDYMPTIAALTGFALPAHGTSGLPLRFDGVDLSGVFLRGHTVAHTSLFHPSCGCGAGELNAMRWLKDGHEYKAIWQTGGVSGCNSPGTKCMHRPEDSPLLFDLTLDEGEAHALDITGSNPAHSEIAKTMVSMRQKVNEDVSSTARSMTDYSGGAAGRAANCCNDANPACAC